jgi:tetratricopeptide (TPR) repeat protein
MKKINKSNNQQVLTEKISNSEDNVSECASLSSVSSEHECILAKLTSDKSSFWITATTKFQDRNHLDLKQALEKSLEYESNGRLNYNKLNFKLAIVDYKKSVDVKCKLLSHLALTNNSTVTNYKNHKSIADMFVNIGICYRRLQNYQNSINNFKKALSIYVNFTQSNDDNNRIGDALNNIGISHMFNKNYRKSLKYFFKANHIYINHIYKHEYHTSVSNTLNNIGLCFSYLDQNEASIEYLNRAIYIRKVLNNYDEDADDLSLSDMYNNLAISYFENGQYEHVFKYFKQSIRIILKLKTKNEVALGDILLNMGMSYAGLNQKQLAIYYYKQAYLIYNDMKSMNEEEFNDFKLSEIFNMNIDEINYKNCFYRSIFCLKLI